MKKSKISFWILMLYAIAWIVATVSRIGYSVFWEDEAYSVWLSKMGFVEMCRTTASDVHPPLYYFILQIFTKILGYEPYIYRLVSVIAYICIIIVIIVFCEKYYDSYSGILMITFLSVLRNTETMAIEVRMYGWVMLFILFAYIMYYEILRTNMTVFYIMFSISILAASYTHYYALLTSFFICIFLLVYAVINHDYLKRTLISLSVIGVIYLPWMYVLLRTFKRTSEDYWIKSIPGFGECMQYIYKSNDMLEIILLILTIAMFIYASFAIKRNKQLQCENNTNIELFWIVSGMIVVILVASTGIIVSRIFRPMFLEKYMYVCIVIGWIILVWGISKVRYGRYLCLIVAIIVFLTQIQFYRNDQNTVRSNQVKQDETMSLLCDSVGTNTIINNTSNDVNFTILLYCFPDANIIEVNDFAEIDAIEIDGDAIIMSEDYIDEATLLNIEENKGCYIEQLVDNGYLGNCNINAYRMNLY